MKASTSPCSTGPCVASILPGSTIKPMMAVAALDSGVTTRERTIWDPGYFQLKESGRRYRDWKRTGHGWVDLMDSVAESCDVYFYQIGVEMGVDVMYDYLSRFGFGEDATLDVAGALSGLLPSRDWKRAVRSEPWYPGDSVNMSIGQGFFLATPLQLATATALIANRGEWVEPRLLKDIRGDRPVAEFLPASTHKPLDLKNPDDWEYVVDTMEEVMHGTRGTAVVPQRVPATVWPVKPVLPRCSAWVKTKNTMPRRSASACGITRCLSALPPQTIRNRRCHHCREWRWRQ